MSTSQIGRIKILATEIFKTFHSLNSTCMKEIFQTNPSIIRNIPSNNNLIAHAYRYNSVTHGKTVSK